MLVVTSMYQSGFLSVTRWFEMTERTQKLKPCPFCGGKNIKSFWFFADTENEKHVRQSAIYCDDCPGQVIVIGFKRDAIAAWNHRAPQCEKE